MPSASSATATGADTPGNNDNNNNDGNGQTQVRQRKPANTAFKQQRLKAWQPILTPKTVLPTFFILGLIFIPLGVGLYIVSNSVDELSFDYTQCPSAPRSLTPPSSGDNNGLIEKWSYDQNSNTCTIEFRVEKTLIAPVFLYYRLTNFYQNHRRYVRSYSAAQLSGSALSVDSLTDCAPLDVNPSRVPYYPCGLIANSMFNDTIGVQSTDYQSFTMESVGNGGNTFQFSAKGIAWPTDVEKYGVTAYTTSSAAPPINWKTYRGRSLNGSWANADAMFNPLNDEHFQVWMRTAGLPTFRKLYGKNTAQNLAAGTYRIEIVYNYPVINYEGTKSIVLSTTSWLGGKNPFLGIAYMTVGVICIVLGVVFLLKHQISPRKLGDHTYLSWNQAAPPMINN